MKKTTPKKAAARKQSTYVAHFRRRQKNSGLRRMEVSVQAKDAGLIKSIVSTLRADGSAAAKLRQTLQAETRSKHVETGADFMEAFKKLTPFGDDISFERIPFDRPYFAFEE